MSCAAAGISCAASRAARTLAGVKSTAHTTRSHTVECELTSPIIISDSAPPQTILDGPLGARIGSSPQT
jgi:hypothetical protein